MLLAACQFDIAWEQKATNLAAVRGMLRSAALPSETLVALPEMFATGYSMNVAAICDDGKEVAALAREFGVWLIAGVVRQNAAGRGLNEALMVSPEGVERERFCKLHPFPLASENQHFDAGQRVVAVRCSGCIVSPMICYDLRFPEGFRTAVGSGAELFVVIANWPANRHDHWRTLLAARAIENQAYVLGVNRCGSDPNANYAGGSMMFDPRGKILAEAGPEPCVLRAEINIADLIHYRKDFPGGIDQIPRL